MKIRVCIPFYSEFETAKFGLQELDNCEEHEFVLEARHGVAIGRLRNNLINDGKSSHKNQSPVNGFDAFLTIDSDIGFTLLHVLKMIEHNKDIVFLPYPLHKNENVYVCGTFSDIQGSVKEHYNTSKKGFQRIDWAGAGMMLIKSHVFEKMEYPWYCHPMIVNGYYQEEANEDIGFCMRAKKAGFDIWCDFDNPVQHKNRNQESFNWDIHNITKIKETQMVNETNGSIEIAKTLGDQIAGVNEYLSEMNIRYRTLHEKSVLMANGLVERNNMINKLQTEVDSLKAKLVVLETSVPVEEAQTAENGG